MIAFVVREIKYIRALSADMVVLENWHTAENLSYIHTKE